MNRFYSKVLSKEKENHDLERGNKANHSGKEKNNFYFLILRTFICTE